VALAQATRKLPDVKLGVSTRGCLALMRAARVNAIASGRPFVRADDVKALVRPVLEHRLVLTAEAEMRGTKPADVIQRVLTDVATPRRRSE
jgi:MoxR-like ATPase